MRVIVYAIKIILSVCLIYLGFSEFLNGMFSTGSVPASNLFWDSLINDRIIQGIAYIIIGLCFILNLKWLGKKNIAGIIIWVFVVNTIIVGIAFNEYLEMIAEIILLLLLYALIFFSKKQKQHHKISTIK